MAQAHATGPAPLPQLGLCVDVRRLQEAGDAPADALLPVLRSLPGWGQVRAACRGAGKKYGGGAGVGQPNNPKHTRAVTP